MSDDRGGDGPGPALPPELWAEVLRRAPASALPLVSRTLHDLRLAAWRRERRERMAGIAAQLVRDVLAVRAVDASLVDRDGLPVPLGVGGTLCDTRGPLLASPYFACPDRDSYRYAHLSTVRRGEPGSPRRYAFPIPWVADAVSSVSFGRPVRDVRLRVWYREAVLHRGRLDAAQEVRLHSRPRVDLPRLWARCTPMEIVVTLDDGSPCAAMLARFQCRMLPKAVRERFERRVAGWSMVLACGRTLRGRNGVVELEDD